MALKTMALIGVNPIPPSSSPSKRVTALVAHDFLCRRVEGSVVPGMPMRPRMLGRNPSLPAA